LGQRRASSIRVDLLGSNQRPSLNDRGGQATEEDDAWEATYQPEDDGVQVPVDEDGDQQPGDGV
jgi:hypothetical protein